MATAHMASTRAIREYIIPHQGHVDSTLCRSLPSALWQAGNPSLDGAVEQTQRPDEEIGASSIMTMRMLPASTLSCAPRAALFPEPHTTRVGSAGKGLI